MDNRGGKPDNPGREGLIAGQTKIRGSNNKRGRPMAVITLPTEVMKAFGWQPGMYLSYYPTTGREMVLVAQDQLMRHVSPDYDLSLTPKGEPLAERAKPGTIADREDEVDRELGDMKRRILGAKRGPAEDDGDGDGRGPLGLSIDELVDSIGREPEPRSTKGEPKPTSPRPRSRQRRR